MERAPQLKWKVAASDNLNDTVEIDKEGRLHFHARAVLQSDAPLPSLGTFNIEVQFEQCPLASYAPYGLFVGVAGVGTGDFTVLHNSPWQMRSAWAIGPWGDLLVDEVTQMPDQARTVDHEVARTFAFGQQTVARAHGRDILSDGLATRRMRTAAITVWDHKTGVGIDGLMAGIDQPITLPSPSQFEYGEQSLSSSGPGRGLVFSHRACGVPACVCCPLLLFTLLLFGVPTALRPRLIGALLHHRPRPSVRRRRLAAGFPQTGPTTICVRSTRGVNVGKSHREAITIVRPASGVTQMHDQRLFFISLSRQHGAIHPPTRARRSMQARSPPPARRRPQARLT